MCVHECEIDSQSGNKYFVPNAFRTTAPVWKRATYIMWFADLKSIVNAKSIVDVRTKYNFKILSEFFTGLINVRI
jgi:hypothetical protein